MTEKLYYADSFMREFTAVVCSCTEGENGWQIILDRTAFYPEGGGQPADRGTLNDVAVIDVRSRGAEIVHICDGPLPVDETVCGRLDWAHRFDCMQQHSGEHIVSGFLCARFGCDNVGFHMGHDRVTIDFNADLTMEQAREIENMANCYIWEDHPVQVSFPSPEQLGRMTYRSKKALDGQVRIVTWPGADCCACCGTHVRSSGQVGLVQLISCQKFREGVRIEMVAGGRAVAYCTAMLDQNLQVSHLLSAKVGETAAAVKKLLDSVYVMQGRLNAMEEADFARRAAQYRGAGDVLLLEGEMEPESLRKLCAAVAATCGGRCAVFAGNGTTYRYVVSQPEGDLRPLAREMNAALHGRGGGKPGFIQGSLQADENAIRNFFQNNA